MTTPLRVDTQAGITTLTFDRASRRNALSRALLEALRRAVARVETDKSRVVILTGGDRCFSAGADITELAGSTEDLAFDAALSDIVAALRGGPFLTIAAIEGPCIGAALDLATACDLRVGSPQALFELPAVRLGLLYNPAAVARLWGILPEPTMKRLLLAGERLDGREALAAGILTHAAEEGQALAAAGTIARSACAVAPSALIHTKRLLVALADGPTDVSAWEDARRALLGSGERQSALAAAKAKRRA